MGRGVSSIEALNEQLPAKPALGHESFDPESFDPESFDPELTTEGLTTEGLTTEGLGPNGANSCLNRNASSKSQGELKSGRQNAQMKLTSTSL
jgi:hypothetical protein